MPASSSKGAMEEYMRCGLVIFLTQRASIICAYSSIFQSKESGNVVWQSSPYKKVDFVLDFHLPDEALYLIGN